MNRKEKELFYRLVVAIDYLLSKVEQSYITDEITRLVEELKKELK